MDAPVSLREGFAEFMLQDRFATRRRKLLKKVKAAKVDALLVTNATNVTYLTGFTGDSSFLLLGPDVEILISDTRYSVQINEECPELETYIRDNSEKIETSVGKVVEKQKLKSLGFESGSTTYAAWETFREKSPGVEWQPVDGLVEELRQVKDAAEIAEIRTAIDLAERAFRVLVASLHPETTEREAAFELENTIRRFGGRGVAFEPIVAVGDRSALPHYRPGERRIGESDFLLVDWGAESAGGYRSDLTRIVAVGKIRPKLQNVYGVVLSAQKAAIAKMGPGASCREVHAAADEVIAKSGFEGKMGHGLGHSFGLEIHEEPRMNSISDSVLEPGMVVTVEPGVYLPGWGGVRIEDDVLITRTGCEVLTSVPKELDEIPTAAR